MLEEQAINLALQNEETLAAVGFSVFILGFIAGLIIKSGSWDNLLRAPYFVISSILYTASSAVPVIYLLSPIAIQYEVFWIIMATVFISIFIISYFYGSISIARSRDAFGHGGYGFLGMIPIANLILLLRSSKNPHSGKHIPFIPLMSGGQGVAFGFVIFAIGAIVSTVVESALNTPS